MSPGLVRLLGILFLLAAIVVAILNLKRVAGLGMTWLAPILMVFGAVMVGLSSSMARRR